jgi:hypothetical protein
MTISTLPQKNISKFFFLWIALSATYYLALSVVANAVPKRIDWIVDSILPAAILIALGVSMNAIAKSTTTQTADELFKENMKFSIYGAVALVIIYMISTIVSPTIVTKDQLRNALDNAELTEAQRQEIITILETENFVSMEELQRIGLNDTQIDQVVSIVSNLGYIRESDVVGIVRTETANMATATAIAVESTCFIEASPEYASVGVRQSPNNNVDNAIAYLARGERVMAVGKTVVNGELWWKVKLSHGNGSVEGWVIDWPVDQSNEVACNNVPLQR